MILKLAMLLGMSLLVTWGCGETGGGSEKDSAQAHEPIGQKIAG